MALLIHSVTMVILCLTMKARSEMSGDLVYSLLSNQLRTMAVQLYHIEQEQASISHRIDALESQQLPPNTDIVKDTVHADKNTKPKQGIMLKALIAEKLFVRRMLHSYDRKFNEFQDIIIDQINSINGTVETTNEVRKREHEENASVLHNAINKLKIESETKLQDVISVFETALNKTSTERVTEYNKLHELMEQMNTNALSEIKSVERQLNQTVDNITKTIENKESSTDERMNCLSERKFRPLGGFKVGDKVRVKSSVVSPKYKWGHVKKHRSVGTVTSMDSNGKDMIIDFPEHTRWNGAIDEMELVC